MIRRLLARLACRRTYRVLDKEMLDYLAALRNEANDG